MLQSSGKTFLVLVKKNVAVRRYAKMNALKDQKHQSITGSGFLKTKRLSSVLNQSSCQTRVEMTRVTKNPTTDIRPIENVVCLPLL